MQHAAALSYTTLLSLVPLMVLTFAVVAAFPVFERFSAVIQDFIFQNFVPAAGTVVQQHLQSFVSKASGLTSIGIAALMFTAILMVATIDKAFNTIWRTRRKRGALAGFMVYWAVLTLGPLLMGVSLAVSSYVVSLPLFSSAATSLGGVFDFLRLMPFLFSTLAFTLLYLVVPNRRVSLRHALAGGVLAAFLFETAKRVFTFYVTQFPTYEAIYGALAAIPIFLVWLYVSWMLALLGAEFTQCLGSFRDQLQHPSVARGRKLRAAFRLLGRLWEAQQQGDSLLPRRLLELEPELTDEGLEETLENLASVRFAHRTDDGAWALSRDIAKVTLGDLYAAHAFVLPGADTEWAGQDPWNRALNQILEKIHGGMGEAMNVPLDTLYRARKETTERPALAADGIADPAAEHALG